MERALGNCLTVVVVDHDHRVRNFIGRCLTLSGVSVILCASGFDGRRAIELADLIMLDLVMPDQDGFEFLHQRDKPDRLTRLYRPAIVVMGPGYPEMGADVRNAGLGYLPKPFTESELIETIVKALPKYSIVPSTLNVLSTS